MMRYREITDGTTTISLIAKSSNSRITAFAGMNSMGGNTPQRDINIAKTIDGSTLIAESYTLNMKGVNTQELAVKCQQLIKLLRKAQNYKKTFWQRTPVYIKEKLYNETNTRYALCFGTAGLNYADLFENITEFQNVITSIGIVLVREHPWRSYIPGTLPTITTLTASDGPSNPTKVVVANFDENNIAITHIYNYDSSAVAWSANLVASTGISIWSVAAAMPAVNDVIYIGSTGGPLKHICIPIAIPGAYTCDIIVQYWKGGGAPVATTLTAGSEYTLLPTGDEDSIFKSVGEWVIDIKPPALHAVATINGVANVWWISIKINAVTAFVTAPVTGSTVCYEQHENYFALPSTAFVGDSNPLTLLRLFNPYGGVASPVMGTPSRIIIGAKSIALSNFHSNLNLGGAGQPAGWALANGTDASSVADVTATGGARGNVSYATVTSMTTRFTLTGTAKLQYWLGRYRVFLRAQQINGANGDCRVKLRAMIGGSASGYPLMDSEIVPLTTHDAGWEVVDLTAGGFLQLPFSDITDADLTGVDLIFMVQTDRTAGVSTLQVADLILIPIDEWAMELRDPISDTTTGASALRGNTLLDIDSGLLLHRVLKQIIVGTSAYPAENWNRYGDSPKLEPNTAYRLYFLMMHYPTAWGTGPMIGSLGMALHVSLYGNSRYGILRGDT
jgi:hypothetical protein